MEILVRVYRLTAAMLVLFATPFVAGCARVAATVEHTCSATDKQFLQTTALNMNMLGYWSSNRAAARVDATDPTDPSLSQTRQIVRAMLSEYWRAVAASAHHREAGLHMMRAYGLANFAHDVLSQAEPALSSRGCDVSSLL
jgi:hypothetical protein